MRRFTPLVAVVAIVAALFHSGPRQAWACYCDGRNASAKTASLVFDQNETLVIGDVLRVVERSSRDDGGWDNLEARVRVEQQLKGSTERDITVQTRADTASCGYDLLRDEGRHFLALEAEGAGVYETTLCWSFPLSSPSGATDTGDFFTTLEALGAEPLTQPEEQHSYRLVSAYIAVSIAALTVLVYASRRQGA